MYRLCVQLIKWTFRHKCIRSYDFAVWLQGTFCSCWFGAGTDWPDLTWPRSNERTNWGIQEEDENLQLHSASYFWSWAVDLVTGKLSTWPNWGWCGRRQAEMDVARHKLDGGFDLRTGQRNWTCATTPATTQCWCLPPRTCWQISGSGLHHAWRFEGYPGNLCQHNIGDDQRVRCCSTFGWTLMVHGLGKKMSGSTGWAKVCHGCSAC